MWYWWVGIVFFVLGMAFGQWLTNNNWIDTHKRGIANFCRNRFWYVLTSKEYCEHTYKNSYGGYFQQHGEKICGQCNKPFKTHT